MSCKYSVLYCGKHLSDYDSAIDQQLNTGIKVLWFGKEPDCKALENKYPGHCKALLLQCYAIASDIELIIKDGDYSSDAKALMELHKSAPSFNYEQYIVEHSSSKHQVVKASAGTGKTSVMIDRILYLMHTVPDLKPSEISMITFTNDAANQMNQRLQDALLTRYELSHNPLYLSLLEQQSQMTISTIDSFAYQLLKQLGLHLGYTNNLSIRSFKYELDGLISHLLDSELNTEQSVEKQIGVKLHVAKKVIYDYWYRLVELGYSPDDILKMNWGEGIDESSKLLQRLLVKTIDSIDSAYSDIKRKKNAVGLIDLLRDLDMVLTKDNPRLSTVNIKYLFVDEFQDTDNSQISVAVKLAALLNLSLFIVGDVKQSIYRFRGADDTAFLTFYDRMKEYGCEKPVEYHLVNNYRTAPAIMGKLHRCFTEWGKRRYLEYDSESVPCKNIDGGIKRRSITPFVEELVLLMDDIKESLQDLNSRIDKKDPKSSDKVVVLARTNYQLSVIGEVCKVNGIPVVVKQDGTFYNSDAVRDFYSLLTSFLFRDPPHLFNYLISPYSSINEPIDLDILRSYSGNKESIAGELQKYLEKTTWGMYDKKIHNTPILTVIKEIIDSEPILFNYAAIMKSYYKSGNKPANVIDKQTYADCKQYKADLDKLLEIVQDRVTTGHYDIFDLCDYLKIMINTNRDESCADADDEFDSSYVYCMTVHKAKGLEFDTVLLPFTDRTFRVQEESDILVDDVNFNVGWKYYKDGYRLVNSHYSAIHKNEVLDNRAEECRILYVALTRAIKNLYVYIKQDCRSNTWGDMMRIGGLDR